MIIKKWVIVQIIGITVTIVAEFVLGSDGVGETIFVIIVIEISAIAIIVLIIFVVIRAIVRVVVKAIIIFVTVELIVGV